MKISVVIPNFNDLRIKRTLDSIYAQTYTNFEVVVADGLSTKSEVLALYKEYPIDILIHEKDKGIFDGLNKGIEHATGDVIFLLGSDDYIRDTNTFEDVVKAFEADRSLDGVCMGCEFINAQNQVIRTWYEKKISSSAMKLGILPPHFSLFLTREIYQKVGPFDLNYSRNIALDAIWLLKLATIKDVHIQPLNQHATRMEYGGVSTGSYKSIWEAMRLTWKAARDYGIKFWFLFPIVKVARKIPQLLHK